MKKPIPSSSVHTAVHPKNTGISRLILAAAMLAGLLVRWAAWTVRAEPAGPVPPLAAVSLEATADTWLRKGNPTINYGGTSFVQTSSYTGSRQHMLLQWDISSVPQSATIDSASITFYVTDASAFDFNLYQMRREWVEGNHEGQQSSVNAPGAIWVSPYYYVNPTPTIPWGIDGAMDTSIDRYDIDLWDATSTDFRNKNLVTIALNTNGLTAIQNWVHQPASNYGMTMQYMGTDNSGDNWIVASSENTSFPGPTLNITICHLPVKNFTTVLLTDE